MHPSALSHGFHGSRALAQPQRHGRHGPALTACDALFAWRGRKKRRKLIVDGGEGRAQAGVRGPAVLDQRAVAGRGVGRHGRPAAAEHAVQHLRACAPPRPYSSSTSA
ncbi:g5192 [Coccomyxa elongata]